MGSWTRKKNRKASKDNDGDKPWKERLQERAVETTTVFADGHGPSCPHCFAVIDGASAFDSEVKVPNEGAVTVCAYCLGFSEFFKEDKGGEEYFVLRPFDIERVERPDEREQLQLYRDVLRAMLDSGITKPPKGPDA